VVNEALSFSLPVITSDQVGAAVDLVSHNENGYLFPVGDVQALADRISQLVELTEEERSRMGENSLSRSKRWNDRDLGTMLSGYLDSVY
jgi:glycosyltransferase involved in cell wall biosynthesis